MLRFRFLRDIRLLSMCELRKLLIVKSESAAGKNDEDIDKCSGDYERFNGGHLNSTGGARK